MANLSGVRTSRLALLVADTDATQSYVFESSKLPEIRGASRQLYDLNQRIGRLVREQANSDLIYAGGGSLLALVPQNAAEALAEQIETLFPTETGAATITAVARPLPDPVPQAAFGQLASWAFHCLSRRKESKTAPPFFEVLPHQTRCASCQKRPAQIDLLAQMPDWPQCQICYNKRTHAQREAWFNRFDEALKGNLELARAYYRDVKNAVAPQTLSEIGQASPRKKGYVAFLYLDGDGIGKKLKQISDAPAYRRLSQALEEATTTAVYTALARHLYPSQITGDELRREVGRGREAGQPVTIHPFEIITIGGDDVLLIVPANAAIPIATAIGQLFGQKMAEAGWPDMTMSAGVVMADDHTPMQILVDLAKQLLQEAKSGGGGRLDFHVLKSADMLDRRLGGARQQYPYLVAHAGQGGRDLLLLARPYTYRQMDALWQQLRLIRQDGFATSQMHLLAASLLDGRQTSTLYFQYQRARHGQAYDRLEKLLKELQEHTVRDPLPWQTVSDRDYSHQTALWDVAELYDFAE
jgi:hypothetical protein